LQFRRTDPLSSGSHQFVSSTLTAPTIDDVARLAGVSNATVSRTLRQPDIVREATRSRVLDAVAQLHYQPNQVAAALAMDRSSTVGILIPNIENPYYYRAYASVLSLAQARGCEVLLKTTGRREEGLRTAICELIEARVCGVAAPGDSIPDEFTAELKERQIAVSSAPAIDYDGGIDRLLRYLADLGHRRIGVVEHHSELKDERIRALRRATRRRPEMSFRTIATDDTLEGGAGGCRQILSDDCGCSAIVCTHDIMAIGALRAARDGGLRVPGDLSIAGIDNIAVSDYCWPALTTVAVSPVSIAAAVCASLFGEGCHAPIPCGLVLRDSTGSAAASVRRAGVA
jgi:LacI family transcriptional regulator